MQANARNKSGRLRRILTARRGSWRLPPNIPPELRAEFDQLGEPVVAQVCGRPYTHAAGQTIGVPAWAADEAQRRHALSWLEEQRNARARREAWLFRITGIGTAFAILSFVAVVYFGFYPRPPIEAPLDPDTLYRGGTPVGHVLGFNVELVLAGQFVFRVETVTPIDKGDVLRFRHATCFVVDVGQVFRMPNDPKTLIFNGTSCRVVGG